MALQFLAAAAASPFFWAGLSVAALAIFTAVFRLARRRITAKRSKAYAEKLQQEFFGTALQHAELEEILKDSGYAYDWQQNLFYSILNPWQRRLGYCRLYDESAAPMSMVIDCEPIRFEYGGKRWLIELWKGQYGLTTGCEIGVYNTTGPDLNIPGLFDGTFYFCAGDQDLLQMSCQLLKDGKFLFSRNGRHWWLTGFRLGEFSRPSELSMRVTLTLKEPAMATAFLSALKELGYEDSELRRSGSSVSLTFSKPHAKQPSTRHGLISWISQRRNKRNCRWLATLTAGVSSMFILFKVVQKFSPALYRLLLDLGKSEKLFHKHQALASRAYARN